MNVSKQQKNNRLLFENMNKNYNNHNESHEQSKLSQDLEQQSSIHNYNHRSMTLEDLDHENSLPQVQQEYDELRQQLVMQYWVFFMNKLCNIIQKKIYWTKFITFKKLYQSSKYKQANDLERRVTFQVQNTNKPQQKLLKLSNKQTDLRKFDFFSQHMIKPSYKKLSHSFYVLKRYSAQKKNQNSESSKQTQSEQQQLAKLIGIRKNQTIKAFSRYTKNFIHKNILKPVFLQILKVSQFVPIKDKIKTATDDKDTRFIKKNVQPHKILQQTYKKKGLTESNSVLNLNCIRFGNHQIKQIKKKHFYIVQSLDKALNRKIYSYFNQFFKTLLQIHLSKQKSLNSDVALETYLQNKNQDNDNELTIMRNVSKTLCYLSSAVSKKFTHHQKLLSKNIFLYKLQKIIKAKTNQNISDGYYSIKRIILSQNNQIISKIQELEQIKAHLLEYFDQSLMEEYAEN